MTAYNNYVNDHSYTNEQHQNLQSSYNQLYNQYQTLLSQLPSSQVLTIESIIAQSVFITPSGIYNVTVRNHSSSDIHVTALKFYYGTILSSSASLLVTVPANSAVTINHYLSWGTIVQVGSGVIGTLRIETLEGYTVTSDPLAYD